MGDNFNILGSSKRLFLIKGRWAAEMIPRRVPHRTLRCDHFNSACCYGVQTPRHPIDVLPELRTVWWMRSVTMADNACAQVYAIWNVLGASLVARIKLLHVMPNALEWIL